MPPKFYGRMEVYPPPQSVSVTISCSKCNGQFSIEKKHHVVSSCPVVYKKDKDGVVAKTTFKEEVSYSLCPGCFEKMKLWMLQH